MLILWLALQTAPPTEAAFQKQPTLSQPTPAPQQWATEIVGKYTGSFLAPGDEDRKSSFSAIAQVVYRWSNRLAIQGTWGFNQIIEPSEVFTLTNPEFRVFYQVAGKKTGWAWLLGPTAAFPVSQDSRDESLYFAAGAASRLRFSNQTEEHGGFQFYYDLGFNRNVHQYETSNTAESNTMSSLDHYFYFEYVFDDSPWTIDAWMGFSSAWTYLSVISNEYSTGQELAYTFSDYWDLILSHERGGNFLSPNGQAYNFGLFNGQESRFSISVKLKL